MSSKRAETDTFDASTSMTFNAAVKSFESCLRIAGTIHDDATKRTITDDSELGRGSAERNLDMYIHGQHTRQELVKIIGRSSKTLKTHAESRRAKLTEGDGDRDKLDEIIGEINPVVVAASESVSPERNKRKPGIGPVTDQDNIRPPHRDCERRLGKRRAKHTRSWRREVRQTHRATFRRTRFSDVECWQMHRIA
ncbi:hypothetical protein BD324DRAFT_492879 [Kockovaella imperatae]|uniref:Uncharacterized protein n=1 Tax=Kockovaella imperatae TaxID=4999 RepID=A0A1Y1UFS9_9TREE|nr:hypothetical protein BD324DRAFT_492879 [Kockovaella imperatae]ORX36387.1 hypothetical protein BD324DRAFT_492879 [Kockovaella imperatae]